jgi:WD40 repeat protein
LVPAPECRTLPGGSAVFSPDGRWLAGTGSGGARVWDVARGEEAAHLPGPSPQAVLFHPGGKGLLTAAEADLLFWPLAHQADPGGDVLLVGPPRPRLRLPRTGGVTLCTDAGGDAFFVVNRQGIGGEVWHGTWDGGGVTGPLVRDDPPDLVAALRRRRGGGRAGVAAAHPGLVSAAASPDGRRLATAAPGGPVKVWDVRTGQPVKELAAGTEVAFSPDGGELVVSAGGEYLFYDTTSWQARRYPGAAPQGAAAFSGDGRLVALAHGPGGVKLLDAGDLRELATLTAGNPGVVVRLALSPDGGWLAVSTRDEVTHLWDLTAVRRALAPLGLDWDAQPYAPAAAGKPALVRVDTGEVRGFTGHDGQVRCLAVTPDGRLALAGADDGVVRLWDLASGREAGRLEGHKSWVRGLAVSADGNRVLTGGEDGLRLWDLDARKELRQFQGPVQGIAWVALAPDGRRALSAGQDGMVRLWDVDAVKELRQFQGHGGPVLSVAFAPDGKQALSGSTDKTVRLWDVESGKEVRRFQGHSDAVWSVAFAPDGRHVFAAAGERWEGGAWHPGSDPGVRMWETSNERPVAAFAAHRGTVRSVAVSADGRRLLTGGVDGSVRLLDVESGRLLRVFQADNLPVTAVAFVPGDRQAVSGGEESTVRLWRLEE